MRAVISDLGGGKDYHFLTAARRRPQPFPDAHVHFHWTINNVDFSYTAIRKPFVIGSPQRCSLAEWSEFGLPA